MCRSCRDERFVSGPPRGTRGAVGSLVTFSGSLDQCDEASPAHTPHGLSESDPVGSEEVDGWQETEAAEARMNAWEQEKEALEMKMEQMRLSLW